MKTIKLLVFSMLFSLSISAQNIPIDFENNGNGANWSWRTFENVSNPPLEIIPNPDPSGINNSVTVAKFTALHSGQPFAGCESLHGSDIGSFTIDQASAIIRIMVWKSVKSDVGIKLVRADNWSLGEIKIANTLVNEWEQLEFDFSAHIGNTYDQIVIFPDFDNRQTNNIIYFDNIYGSMSGFINNQEITDANVSIYPNPCDELLFIASDDAISSINIFAVTGAILDQQKTKAGHIDVTHLSQGIYLLEVVAEGQSSWHKFIKK